MEEFVAYIVKNLVAKPEEVIVTLLVEGQEQICIEIRVASEDIGKVIGRRGNTINALRTIVRTVATRLGRRVQVELIQPAHCMQQEEDAEFCEEPEPVGCTQ